MNEGTDRAESGGDPRTAKVDGGVSRRGITGALAAGLLLLLLAAPGTGSAQELAEGLDPGWLPWLGCWKVVDRQMNGSEEAAPSTLCVRPSEEGSGVQFLTVREGRITGREPVRADDRRRESAREECAGWERGAFSDDGHRVYLRSEHVCPGDVERTSTGLLAWISPYEWMEVRTVEVRGSPRTWVRRYQVATAEDVAGSGLAELTEEPTMGIRSARIAAASPVGVDEIIETSSRTHPEALGAWLAEQADPLDLDADALVRMADAGVSENVIDVAVAVSYPDRFVLDRGGAVEEQERAGARGRGGYRPARGYGVRGWYGRSYRYRPYRPYRLYDPFYSPWGYTGYSGYGYGYGYRPSVVYVAPRSDTGGGSVVNERGYTRSSGGGSGQARPRSRPSSGGSSSPSPSAGRGDRGGSSGGAVSPSGGYRGGSSGGDTGRSARPRGSDDSGSGGNEGGNGSGSR